MHSQNSNTLRHEAKQWFWDPEARPSHGLKLFIRVDKIFRSLIEVLAIRVLESFDVSFPHPPLGADRAWLIL
jgi:hypothetical protein